MIPRNLLLSVHASRLAPFPGAAEPLLRRTPSKRQAPAPLFAERNAGAAGPPPPPPPPRNSEPTVASTATRLATELKTAPFRIDQYFRSSYIRQLAWCIISAGMGFYVANTVSLTFGALAINDVIAAVLVVVFAELVSALCYTAPRWTYKLLFLNWFKIGLSAALIADAWKLAG